MASIDSCTLLSHRGYLSLGTSNQRPSVNAITPERTRETTTDVAVARIVDERILEVFSGETNLRLVRALMEP